MYDIDEDNDYAVNAAAKDLGMPPEQVKMVVNNLWKAVRFYLSNPHLVRKGVRLTGFITIKLSVSRMEAFIERMMFTDVRLDKRHPGLQYMKDILVNLHKIRKDEEKIHRDIQRHAKLEEHIGRGACIIETSEGSFDLLQFARYARRKRREQRKQYNDADA